MGNVEKILESEDVAALGRYLAILIEEEYAYEIVDQIGKSKSPEEFIDGVWRAMRLSKKLESRCSKYSEIIPSSENVKRVLAFIEEDQRVLKFLSRYLGSLAFTTWNEIEKIKKECEKKSGGEE